jgi:hypothetical protein
LEIFQTIFSFLQGLESWMLQPAVLARSHLNNEGDFIGVLSRPAVPLVFSVEPPIQSATSSKAGGM